MKQLTYILLITLCYYASIKSAAKAPQEKQLPAYLSTQIIGLYGSVGSLYPHHVPIAATFTAKFPERLVRSYFGFVSSYDLPIATALARHIEQAIQTKTVAGGDKLVYDNDYLQAALSKVIGKNLQLLAQVGACDIRLFNFEFTKDEGQSFFRIVSLKQQIDDWKHRVLSPSRPQPSITRTEEAMAREALDVRALCGQGIILPAEHMHLLHELYICHKKDSTQAERLAALKEYAKVLFNLNPFYSEIDDYYSYCLKSIDTERTPMTRVPVLLVDIKKYMEHAAQILSAQDTPNF